MGLGKTVQVIAFLAGLECSNLLSDGGRYYFHKYKEISLQDNIMIYNLIYLRIHCFNQHFKIKNYNYYV